MSTRMVNLCNYIIWMTQYLYYDFYEQTYQVSICFLCKQNYNAKNVDVAINSSLRTIWLSQADMFQLPVLAGIAPAGLRRKAATLALGRKAVKHDCHILHNTTKNEVPPCRFKSRKHYNKEPHEMLNVIPEDQSKDALIAATWKQEWEASRPT